MKKLSWDVGVKNLAYCVLELKDGETRILDWDIVDISVKTEADDKKCEHITVKNVRQNNKTLIQTSTPCKNPAKKYGKDVLGHTHYFCGSHASKYIPYENHKSFEEWYLDACKTMYAKEVNRVMDPCEHPTKSGKCGKGSKFVDLVENVSTCRCTVHHNLLVKNLKKSTELKPLKKSTNCTHFDPQQLADNMFTKLSVIPSFTNIQKILIENQPTLTNPTMKTVSVMLFSYFSYQNKAATLANPTTPNTIIKFKSPSNKLKISPNIDIHLMSSSISADDLTKFIKIINPYTKQSKTTENAQPIDYTKVLQLVFYKSANRDPPATLHDHMYVIDNIWGPNIKKQNKQNKQPVKAVENVDVENVDVEQVDVEQVDVASKNDKTVYNITKLLSVIYTKYLVEHVLKQPEWLKFINEKKKSDDLCDSFLQAYEDS